MGLPTTFTRALKFMTSDRAVTLTGIMNLRTWITQLRFFLTAKFLVASGEGSTNPDASNQQIT